MFDVPADLIAQFVGQKVEVTEKTFNQKYRGKTFTITQVNVVPNDPTIAALKKAAGGYNLRIWRPSTVGTMDFRLNRLNVYLERESETRYRIAKLALG